MQGFKLSLRQTTNLTALTNYQLIQQAVDFMTFLRNTLYDIVPVKKLLIDKTALYLKVVESRQFISKAVNMLSLNPPDFIWCALHFVWVFGQMFAKLHCWLYIQWGVLVSLPEKQDPVKNYPRKSMSELLVIYKMYQWHISSCRCQCWQMHFMVQLYIPYLKSCWVKL